jgi:hypothetical protein
MPASCPLETSSTATMTTTTVAVIEHPPPRTRHFISTQCSLSLRPPPLSSGQVQHTTHGNEHRHHPSRSSCSVARKGRPAERHIRFAKSSARHTVPAMTASKKQRKVFHKVQGCAFVACHVTRETLKLNEIYEHCL